MIQLLSANGTAPYGLYKFAIDSIDDLVNLPKGAKMGSEAIVTATSDTYIKNGNGEWVIKITSGGSGGGSVNATAIPDATLQNVLNEIFNEEGEKE